MSISIKNGGFSSYAVLNTLDPKPGDTFLSQDGTVLVFIRPSGYVVYLHTGAQGEKHPVFGESTIHLISIHHTFKRVNVELVIRAV